MDLVPIGKTSLRVAKIAMGTWAWGDKRYWSYDPARDARGVVDAFAAAADAGITLFDTAEVYGHGESEKILGWLARKRGGSIQVATKFGLLPGRDGARALPRALDQSLRRLGMARVDLYQVHWPDSEMASIPALMDAMADAFDAGKIGAVGVSNFGGQEMRDAHEALARRGIPLASNQVRYSLLHRAPEADGVLDACRELGVTLLAYSPLEQGILSGKYGPDRRPIDLRSTEPAFSREGLEAAAPAVALLKEIGDRRGLSPEAIALAWCASRPGVVPIAGARTGEQAERNASALGITLDAAERDALDRLPRA
jgi:aryl-alcohol dehydrogenase-like predicted oxidoreductase